MNKSTPVMLSLTYDENGWVNGYEIKSPIPEPPSKDSVVSEVIERIRDMHYYNLEKEVVYDGRTSYPDSNQTNSLKFKLKSRKDE